MFHAICNYTDGTGAPNYFGVCPKCHKTDGYINIGRGHWFYCKEHKNRWFVGENLFSTWRDQSEEEQRRIYDELEFESFRDV
jgi:ssDNA-binding Zn-finger/Zn-ribbon topoisomerase 1